MFASTYQAITTRFVGPTDTKQSRIIATTASGKRLVMKCDDAANLDEAHGMAAWRLAESLGWTDLQGVWFGGSTKDGYCFVCTPHNSVSPR
jgi:hypothetical protein